MKISLNLDSDIYNTGYYHSYIHPYGEKEMDDFTKINILNKINLNYEKKDLINYLLNPLESTHDKIIKCLKNENDFNYNKYGVTITNGGLLDDWIGFGVDE